MTLEQGRRLGPYEIQSLVGSGGMGEVYRARDTRLDRTVALKVLPRAVHARGEARKRFEREARVLSSLNHPNICVLHDVGSQEGLDFIVMEFVEGETLAKRLRRGRLRVDEALQIAIEIADALEKAHRGGVIHRDLKPGNVILSKTGVKLLDFGISKLIRPDLPPLSDDMSDASTDFGALTSNWEVLGTLQYMAPEQLRGQETDARSDLFGFGAVLYEMLTGDRAFSGKSQTSVVAAILDADPPPVSASQPAVPLILDRLILKCLAKDPDKRWQTATDLLHELEWIADHELDARRPAATARQRERLAWALAILFGVALTATLMRSRGGGVAEIYRAASAHFTIVPPSEAPVRLSLPSVLALSPDGMRLVYVARPGNSTKLYIRSMNQLHATPIDGTEHGEQPFFSPDGQWIGFFAEGKLRKVALAGGSALTVAETPQAFGATWTRDDTIWFGTRRGILRVAASGGKPEPAIPLEPGESAHYSPQFLPGGKAVLFMRFKDGRYSIVAHSLATGERHLLIEPGRNARYVSTGHIIYALDDGSLFAAPFDVENLAMTGSGVPVLDGVLVFGLGGAAQYTLSDTGTLVYLPRPNLNALTTVTALIRRDGTMQNLPMPLPYFEHPRFSPDGSKLVVTSLVGNPDIWVHDLESHDVKQLTFDAADDETPIWSPDRNQVAFRRGPQLYSKPADGREGERLIATLEESWHLGAWSPDGRHLMLNVDARDGKEDIWILSLTSASPSPKPLLATPANERSPSFSPNGEWLAYSSDHSGRDEIYLREFSSDGAVKAEVISASSGGGTEPRWSSEGDELFYRSGDRIMVVPVQTSPALRIGKPRVYFEGRFSRGHREYPNYDVAPNRRGILMISEEQQIFNTGINVILDWVNEVRRRAGGS
ncbi:MAG: serine/threonine-protein kinase [Acidobacteria bacterium]|nr:serine/threonine-protein kinase [Acidobacteriota bacterium]